MNLSSSILTLHPKAVFRISRASRAEVQNVIVRVASDGIEGLGEASPNAFYGETAPGVIAQLEKALPLLADLNLGAPTEPAAAVAEIGRVWEALWPLLAPSRAAQCALDLALWDWLAQRHQTTVCELAHGHRLRPIPTFVTLGLSSSEELAEKVAPIRDWPLIKIKSDALADLGPAAYVRENSGAKIAVDANCAWPPEQLPRLGEALAGMGALFLEQPLPPGADFPALAIPVIADESCVVQEDIERLPEGFSGFNIKLVKCGGLTPALRMARRGRERGLKTMVGCMLETSLLIAAGAVAAQGTDYADLDGAWLLRDEPFDRVRIERGILLAGPGGGSSLPIL